MPGGFKSLSGRHCCSQSLFSVLSSAPVWLDGIFRTGSENGWHGCGHGRCSLVLVGLVFFGIALLGPYLFHWQAIEFVRLTKTIKCPRRFYGWRQRLARYWQATATRLMEKTGNGTPRSVPLDMLAKIGAYVFVLGLLVILSEAVKSGFDYVESAGSGWTCFALILAPLTIFLLFGWRVDVNDFSLNTFYRNRLTRCYLGASNRKRAPNPLTGFDDRDTRGMQISRLTPDTDPKHMYTGPFPIFCTAINHQFWGRPGLAGKESGLLCIRANVLGLSGRLDSGKSRHAT